MGPIGVRAELYAAPSTLRRLGARRVQWTGARAAEKSNFEQLEKPPRSSRLLDFLRHVSALPAVDFLFAVGHHMHHGCEAWKMNLQARNMRATPLHSILAHAFQVL